MTLFRPTCRPTEFDADLRGDVLIPHAVNYIRRHPAGTLDAHTREILRRELVKWLAEHDRPADPLLSQEPRQDTAGIAEILEKVKRALDRLDASGSADRVEPVANTPNTLAS